MANNIILILSLLTTVAGTFMAGLSVLCCSRIRQKNTTKSSVVWVNTWVALLQLVTTFLFLLGWIWSVMWGAAFLSISDEYYKKPSDKATRASADANGSTAPDATRPLAVTRTSGTPPDNIMISLKAAPLIRMQPPPPPPEDRIMQTKSRQQILMERHLVHSELSPFNVTEERLQDIVLHNVPDRGGRRSARPDECGGTVIDDIRSET